jgi:hypothetical protein
MLKLLYSSGMEAGAGNADIWGHISSTITLFRVAKVGQILFRIFSFFAGSAISKKVIVFSKR